MSQLYSEYAALYDAAFDWDVTDQVAAIGGLSGLTSGRVLEPMCGSGRMARAFAAEGFRTVGVDNSPQMLAIAKSHYASAELEGTWIEADVTSFSLDEACDLAVCPINSLAHLPSVGAMGQHLMAVSQNLYSGSSYWLQLDLKRPEHVGDAEEWEFEYRGETVRVEWACSAYHDGFETHITRFVFPDGRILEDDYQMKVWSYADWSALLAASRFELSGAYIGDAFTPLDLNDTLDGEHVFWQQLVKLR